MLRSVWEDDVVDEKVIRKLTTILAADVERATSEILPRILAAEGRASAMMRGGGEASRSLEQGL